MPFMVGRAPVRRTIKYLEAGRIVLKDKIRIFSINYNIGLGFKNKVHEGKKISLVIAQNSMILSF
jgi:hypothetical protein